MLNIREGNLVAFEQIAKPRRRETDNAAPGVVVAVAFDDNGLRRKRSRAFTLAGVGRQIPTLKNQATPSNKPI